MEAPTWYAKLFQCTTGLMLGDVPLDKTPGALQQINAQGNWTVATEIGVAGGLQRDTLRINTKGHRFGIAVCYGTRTASDYIFQAGPITNAQLLQESPPVYQLSGGDPWDFLNGTLLISPSSGSVVTYTSSMQGIAVAILNAALARNPLPIDVPAAISGTATRTYNWWDFAYAGALLQALTQASLGPDIYFRPYFSDASHLRWQAVIGNPYITQGAGGVPLLFDQSSNLIEVRPVVDSSKLAGTTWAKGNGVEAGTLFATATDPTLSANGWPALDYVDSSQVNLTDLTALGAVASGALALYGKSVETWSSWVRTDGRHPLGSYGPGLFATYNFTTHPLIPPGRYRQRILGMARSQGDDANTIQHVLHATQGVI
jgi:hypothetical protein